MRLESPFNRQGTGLSKTRLMADVLRDQVTELHFDKDFLTVITVGNLSHREEVSLTNALAFLFFICLMCFGSFFDLEAIWQEENPFTSLVTFFRSTLHPRIANEPWEVLLTAPFYIQLVIAICSLGGYFSVFALSKNTFLNRGLQVFFTYLCKGLSFPFLVLSVSNCLSQLILLIESTSHAKWIFIMIPILAVFSIPMTVIGVLRALVDVKMNKMPFSTSNTRKAVQWLTCACFFICFESFLQAITTSRKEFKTLIVIAAFLLALNMVRDCFYVPFFLSPISQALSSGISVYYVVGSFTALIQLFATGNNLGMVCSIITLCSLVLGMGASVLRQHFANRKIEESNFDIKNIKSENDIMRYFTFCYSRNIQRMKRIDILSNLEQRFPGHVDLLIMALRYIADTDQIVNVFETSVYLLKLSLDDVYHCLLLFTLIETSQESVNTGSNNNSMTVRQRQMDMVMERCVDAQVEFWRAVLQDDTKQIAEASVALADRIESTHSFFEQMGIARDRERSSFWVRYVDFVMNITAELGLLKDVMVDSRKQIRYDQRFKMHQPRRDAQKKVAKAPIFKQFEDVHGDADDGFTLLSNPHPHQQPRQPVEATISPLISKDRIELCEATSNVKVSNKKLRVTTMRMMGIVMLLVALIMFIIAIAFYGDFVAQMEPAVTLYDGTFRLYNASCTAMIAATGHMYSIPNAITDPVIVDGMLKDTISHLQENTRFVQIVGLDQLENISKAWSRIITVNETTDHAAVAMDESMIGAAWAMTSITNKVLTATQKLADEVSELRDSICTHFTNLQIAAAVIFVATVPFEIYGLVQGYKALKHLFWQPLVIDKSEVAEVFQVFLKLATTERRKSCIEPKIYKDVSQRRSSKYGGLFIRIFIKIFTLHTLLYVCLVVILVIMRNEINTLCDNTLSYTNCSGVFAHYHSNIYRLMPLSSWLPNGIIYVNWLNSSLECFQETAYLTGNEASQSQMSYMVNGIAVREAGVIPIVPMRFSNFDTLSLFPIPNASANYWFYRSMRMSGSIIREVLMCLDAANYTGEGSVPSTRVNVQIENSPDMAYFMEETNHEFMNNVVRVKVAVPIFLVVFAVLELFMLWLTFAQLDKTKNINSLIIRLMLLLPNRTPFVEPHCTDIHLFDKKPDSPTQKIMEYMPVGMVILGSERKCLRANRLAKDFFGDDIMGKKIKDLSSDRYLESSKFRMARFPLHPFDKMDMGMFKSFVVYNDVTKQKNGKRMYKSVQLEIKQLRKMRIPPSVATSRGGAASILILDSFAIVEISIISESMSDEHFLQLKRNLTDMIDLISTVFLCEITRSGIFAVFTSFNAPRHQRQYLRDAMKCTAVFNEAFRELNMLKNVKISVTDGEQCLVKVTDDECAHLSFYAENLPKAFTLMQHARYGETVVEWSILKNIGSTDTPVESIQTGKAFGVNVEFCVLSNEDNQWQAYR